MAQSTHYMDYDVMKEKPNWDSHTQTIVSSRLLRESEHPFLTLEEAELLRSICTLLVDDTRGDIIQNVIDHIDDTLFRSIGEGQRKAGVPDERSLVRLGLKSIEDYTLATYANHFYALEENVQLQYMADWSEGGTETGTFWSVPPKALFLKLLSLTVEAYYSHPQIWSEIGYGGPAYPRGYVRTAIGQTDPWEAVRMK
ncbi:gluconate 2-dehydrogenase subunit 3 family protein [Paenibacillus sp. MBLB4367]|uniref:gluconate 2-dehydrogenase subunit 3 family protein n=1 Tax=Paenibacillus sp. MBLB4367 TaxID=3384767 RepID=UPI0039083DE3